MDPYQLKQQKITQRLEALEAEYERLRREWEQLPDATLVRRKAEESFHLYMDDDLVKTKERFLMNSIASLRASIHAAKKKDDGVTSPLPSEPVPQAVREFVRRTQIVVSLLDELDRCDADTDDGESRLARRHAIEARLSEELPEITSEDVIPAMMELLEHLRNRQS